MTIVTTSRKPLTEIRSLAKDFAFAAGCRYMVRGKMGLREIRSFDPVQIIFELQKGMLSLTLYDGTSPSYTLFITGFRIATRQGSQNGIRLKDLSIYERLVPYVPVKLSEDGDESCVFDGTHSRRYLLSLKIHEA